ncbi:MAG TPA: Rieske 2Fe-2S domain-containing protein [Planctomicrobium sp.]|nr:Rieske 2Fe-2S domain-containing protein [Planctomicrobium sp.]
MKSSHPEVASSVEVKSAEDHPPRRSFLVKAAALLVAGVTATVPLFIAFGNVLSPLFRRSKTAAPTEETSYFVGKTGGLIPGGPPQILQVIGTKKDAWTTYPGIALGSVLVRLDDEGQIVCLNARCTHLGCTVGYQSTENRLYCPCHAASFSLNGERFNQTPPRNLDRLDAEIRNGDEIWVRFQNFRSGTEEQIPV